MNHGELSRIERQIFNVDLPLPPPELSPNRPMHWAKKARFTKAYREACGWAFKQAMPKSWQPMAVVIDMEYRAFRGCGGYQAYDVQNCIASTKASLDGAIDAGLIPSDSKRWLSWGVVTLLTTKKEALARGGAGISICVRSA